MTQAEVPGSSQGAMWGGRFESGPDELFRAVNDSLPFDWRLVEQDIRGSRAWANALAGAGVLSEQELGQILDGLQVVALKAATLPSPPVESGAEDVHTWVEQELVATAGDVGKKLHTGRSRNDQVATDLRLWTMQAIADLQWAVLDVQAALVDLASEHAETPCPAFTHLQAAQPIVFGHWAMAYVAMLDRDLDRLADARRRTAVCPLGSAALAGTTFPVDREQIARELSFEEVSANSLDAVSDRDYVADVIGAIAQSAVHLSRMAEDLIVYASPGYGMVTFSDKVSSGSSLMPQKKNPDALELIRGKAARLIGAQVTLLTLGKGLPMAYNKDLQEDKPALFGAVDEFLFVLRLAALNVREKRVNAEACRALATTGYQNATELADHLVERGVPFREAHEQVGLLVRAAMKKGTELEGLSLQELREHAPACEEAVYKALEVGSALQRRDVEGGTAPSRVTEAAKRARASIASSRAALEHLRTPS